jgi:hypothetical protein
MSNPSICSPYLFIRIFRKKGYPKFKIIFGNLISPFFVKLYEYQDGLCRHTDETKE